MKCYVLSARCWVLVLAIVLGAPAFVEACPICFRDPESPMTAGVMAGVGTLLSITAGVLGGISVLIRRLVRAETTRPSAEREDGR
ncbi:MAG: hypothetical protein M3Q55_03060 [Acidobacteriota bacterium]|nr:hypothetical protein [Acidobacteriota bacterium]